MTVKNVHFIFISQRNSKFIIPWLISEFLCLVFSGFAAISKGFELLLYNENLLEGFGAIFSIFILVGIELYLYLCIYSLYQVLRTEERNQRQMQMNEINQAAVKDQHDGLPPYSALS